MRAIQPCNTDLYCIVVTLWHHCVLHRKLAIKWGTGSDTESKTAVVLTDSILQDGDSSEGYFYLLNSVTTFLDLSGP